jgi:hypothetical protein
MIDLKILAEQHHFERYAKSTALTHALANPQAMQIALRVREALDRRACPDLFMIVAMEETAIAVDELLTGKVLTPAGGDCPTCAARYISLPKFCVVVGDDCMSSYRSDYPTAPIGDGNPYWACVYCGRSDPQINGELSGHSEHCEWRKTEEAKLLSSCAANKDCGRILSGTGYECAGCGTDLRDRS